MFKARYMTPAEVDEFYRQTLARYERVLFHEHLNRIAADVPEDLLDHTRAESIIAAIVADWKREH